MIHVILLLHNLNVNLCFFIPIFFQNYGIKGVLIHIVANLTSKYNIKKAILYPNTSKKLHQYLQIKEVSR